MTTSNATLIAHKDTYKVSRDAVMLAPCPSQTDTFHPIPHRHMLELVEGEFARLGWDVESSEFAMNKSQSKCFGTYNIRGRGDNKDYTLAVGMRNANDKSLPAGLCLGSRVFVCDNLAFSADFTIGRRHTSFIERDLPTLIAGAIAQFSTFEAQQEADFTRWKALHIPQVNIRAILKKGVEAALYPERSINKVESELNTPRFTAFNGHQDTAWGMFNAITTHHRHDRKLRPDAMQKVLLDTHQFIRQEFAEVN